MAYFNNKQNIKGGGYLPTPIPSDPPYNPPAIPTAEEGSDVNIPIPTFHGEAIVTLYNNISDNDVVNKKLSGGLSFTINIKDDISILEPKVMLETTSDLTGYNYAYIDISHRYYYATLTYMDNGLYLLDMTVDALMSHRARIKNSSALVLASENFKNDYLPSNIWQADVRDTTTQLKFENPTHAFTENPVYVLITAGATI